MDTVDSDIDGISRLIQAIAIVQRSLQAALQARPFMAVQEKYHTESCLYIQVHARFSYRPVREKKGMRMPLQAHYESLYRTIPVWGR